ncbi:hypothetical protein LTR17_022040 [Elasticomyces elasticus]|nr:hypothetical protein LTR17_022040 [Elasticomyces elasticus]
MAVPQQSLAGLPFELRVRIMECLRTLSEDGNDPTDDHTMRRAASTGVHYLKSVAQTCSQLSQPAHDVLFRLGGIVIDGCYEGQYDGPWPDQQASIGLGVYTLQEASRVVSQRVLLLCQSRKVNLYLSNGVIRSTFTLHLPSSFRRLKYSDVGSAGSTFKQSLTRLLLLCSNLQHLSVSLPSDACQFTAQGPTDDSTPRHEFLTVRTLILGPGCEGLIRWCPNVQTVAGRSHTFKTTADGVNFISAALRAPKLKRLELDTIWQPQHFEAIRTNSRASLEALGIGGSTADDNETGWHHPAVACVRGLGHITELIVHADYNSTSEIDVSCVCAESDCPAIGTPQHTCTHVAPPLGHLPGEYMHQIGPPMPDQPFVNALTPIRFGRPWYRPYTNGMALPWTNIDAVHSRSEEGDGPFANAGPPPWDPDFVARRVCPCCPEGSDGEAHNQSIVLRFFLLAKLLRTACPTLQTIWWERSTYIDLDESDSEDILMTIEPRHAGEESLPSIRQRDFTVGTTLVRIRVQTGLRRTTPAIYAPSDE